MPDNADFLNEAFDPNEETSSASYVDIDVWNGSYNSSINTYETIQEDAKLEIK